MNTTVFRRDFPNKVHVNKAPEVPHYDVAPNHEKHLAAVMLAAEEKRARKRARNEQNKRGNIIPVA